MKASCLIGLNVFYIVHDRPDQIRSMLFLVFFLSNKIRVFQLIFPDPMNVSYLIQMICYQSALCTSIVFYSNPRCYPHLWQNKKEGLTFSPQGLSRKSMFNFKLFKLILLQAKSPDFIRTHPYHTLFLKYFHKSMTMIRVHNTQPMPCHAMPCKNQNGRLLWKNAKCFGKFSKI